MDVSAHKYLKSAQAVIFIQSYILQNRLQSGDVIPSENFLCKRLNLSRCTIRRAIQSLADLGILTRRIGSGTYVNDTGKIDSSIHMEPHGNVVVIMTENEYNHNITVAMERVFSQRDIKIVSIKPKTEAEIIEQLSCLNKNKLDGCIIIANKENFSEKISRLLDTMPMVFINEPTHSSDTVWVASDDYSGSYNAVRYLITLGHQKILHIAGPRDLSTSKMRTSGYENAMRQAGLQQYVSTEYCDYNFDKAYSWICRLLDMNADFSAVFCASDNMAHAVYRACREHNIIIPDQLSILGYGNLQPIYDDMPGLTTVNQNPDFIGERAANILMTKIFREGNWNFRYNSLVPVQLIIRDSCTFNRSNK